MSGAPAPPRLPRLLLQHTLPEDAHEVIVGDLHELHAQRRATLGAVAAATWYWLEALSILMRFAIDHIARSLRGLFSRDVQPSALDLKLGARMLGKSPGLTLVGGFAMAVAVALGAGAYAFFNTYFYPEITLHEGDRVVAIAKYDRQRRREDERLLHDFLVWRRELRTVVDVGAFRTARRNIIEKAGQGEPIRVAEMSASGFRLARVPTLRGRGLVEDDERPGAPPVMVIGYDAWQSRFAADPAILGREIRLGRTVHTVVGVMPQGFAFPVNHQYWIPLRIDPDASRGAGPRTPVAPGTGPDLDVFARLAPGATKASAQAELTALGRRLAAEGPKELAHLEPRIVRYDDIVTNGQADGTTETFAVLRFVIALLLVVVATNVAVLVYARTAGRSGEIAVRTALGATRGRIVTQLFAEAFVLSALSAMAGLAIVAVGLNMMDAFIAEVSGGRTPFWIDPGLSLGTVVYALALALLAAVIIGVLPALRATGAQLRTAMGSLGSGGQAKLGKTWTVLIVAQVAIAVAVLPPAMRNGAQIVRGALAEPGFPTGEYLSANYTVEREQGSANASADSLARDSARTVVTALLTRLAAEPGVVGATVTDGQPWNAESLGIEVNTSTSSGQAPADVASQQVLLNWVDTSFFRLYDVRVLAGRAFVPADAALRHDDRPVVVNRSFVAELLDQGNPIGRRVRYWGYGDQVNPWHTIVGVVEDFPSSIMVPGMPSQRMMYQLVLPGEWEGNTLTVRLRGQTPETFAPTLRRIATSVDPMLQLTSTSPMDARYRESRRDAMRLALVIALVTGSVLLLSAAGIHALMTFTVNQRRREIGIRAALGAPGQRILASVLARAARQLALGVGVGLAASVAMDVAAGGALMSGAALLLVPGTALFMLAVGLLAAAEPARRGLRVQPTEALRAE